MRNKEVTINKTILTKLNEKTKDEKEMKQYLSKLFEFEASGRGWYEKEYKKILEECYPVIQNEAH